MPSTYDWIKSGAVYTAQSVFYGVGYIITPAVAAYGARAAVQYAVNPTHLVGLAAQNLAREYVGYAAFSLAGPVGGVVCGFAAGAVVKGAYYVAESGMDAYRKRTQNQASLHNVGPDLVVAEFDEDEPEEEAGDRVLHVHSNALVHQPDPDPAPVQAPANFLSRFSIFSKNQPLPVPPLAEQARAIQPGQIIDENVLRMALQPEAPANSTALQ